MKVCIFGNGQKPEALLLIEKLTPWLEKRAEITCVMLEKTGAFDPKDADVCIVFGGDGTMLSCARRLTRYDIPVIGVNLGRLGFLAGIPPKFIHKELKRVFAGEYSISERLMLEVVGLNEADITSGFGSMVVLNEVVLERGESPRTLSVDVHHGDEYFNTFSADGLIVATPTGSTAYSLSAGGPLCAPELDVMIINPICPHCLSERPFIVSTDKSLRLHLSADEPCGMITLDGQTVYRPKGEISIEVRRFEHKLKLLKPPEVGDFSVIRSKLNWGRNFIPFDHTNDIDIEDIFRNPEE